MNSHHSAALNTFENVDFDTFIRDAFKMKDSSAPSPKRFAFISTCPELWGGSEELWGQAAAYLAANSHSIMAFKTGVDRNQLVFRQLTTNSSKVWDLNRIRIAQRVINLLLPARHQLTPAKKQALFLATKLKPARPNLVVISQGDNYDGVHFGELCLRLKLRYVLISQKATDFIWPRDPARARMRRVYESAERCFFVSNTNRQLTEDQIGADLSNAELVRNPYLVSRDTVVDWPDTPECEVKLACVARLFLLDKGQDILLRVLGLPKWRERRLSVSFFGSGVNRDSIVALAERLNLSNASFLGHTSDVTEIWKNHHALVMASRTEGLPLTLVEAMMCGRPAIVTDVGGNAEVIEDNVTGFIAAAASVKDMDEAMERAWLRRQDWCEIGRRAAASIKAKIPPHPQEIFAKRLIELAEQPGVRGGRLPSHQVNPCC